MAEKSSSIHLVPPYIISPWCLLQFIKVQINYLTCMCCRLGWCCSTPSPRCPAATARPSNPTSSHTFYPSHRSGTYPQLEDISLLLNTRPARDIWILNKSFALFPLEIYRHTYRYRKLQISSLWFTFNCNLIWKQMSWYGHVQHYVNSVWTLNKLLFFPS